MEILTEFDELQAALAKVKMDECVLPYYKGRLISENAFNKTQKILNCPEMISAHKFLYNLDMDQLTEEDECKIDKLYQLGCDRGFIIDDLTDWDAENGVEDEQADVAAVDVQEPTRQPQNTLFKAKIPCWTVIYSATKDGDIKTGEAYSNAVSINAAKADVNAKLSQCGYDNITILAIENCMNAPAKPEAVSEADKEDKEDKETDDGGDSEKADDTSDDSADDSSEDDAGDDTADDSSSDDSSDENADDSSSDDSADDSTDDSSSDDAGDEGSSDEASDDAEDSEGSDDSEDADDSSDEEPTDSEEPDEGSDDESSENDEDSDSGDEPDELDANKKAELRDQYRKTFKNTLVKCKFETSFNDLTLEQKVKFFTELSKAWKKDNEPKDFMTDKELEQLDNVVAYTGDDSDDSSED